MDDTFFCCEREKILNVLVNLNEGKVRMAEEQSFVSWYFWTVLHDWSVNLCSPYMFSGDDILYFLTCLISLPVRTLFLRLLSFV